MRWYQFKYHPPEPISHQCRVQRTMEIDPLIHEVKG